MQVPDALKAIERDTRGEFSVVDDRVYWEARFDTPDGEECHDVAWDLYTSAAALILYAGYEPVESGSDNDTTWCFIGDEGKGDAMKTESASVNTAGDIPCIMLPIEVERLDALEQQWHGARVVGRLSSGDLLFEHGGFLWAFDSRARVLLLDPISAPSASTEIKATKLDLPWPALKWQDVPGGCLVTFLQLVRQPGIIGQPQVIPVGTSFIPGVYLVQARDKEGVAGVYAVKIGVTLDELGLKRVEEGN